MTVAEWVVGLFNTLCVLGLGGAAWQQRAVAYRAWVLAWAVSFLAFCLLVSS